jgi:hypothetical protein
MAMGEGVAMQAACTVALTETKALMVEAVPDAETRPSARSASMADLEFIEVELSRLRG